MSSLHFCHHRINLQQTLTYFPSVSPSTPNIANVETPSRAKSSEVRSLRLNSLSQRHAHVVNQLDKSLEPSVSSSSGTCGSPLRIGIVGLGAFGQFLGKAFQRQGHCVLGTSRSDYSEYCQDHGIQFFRHLNGLCEAQPDILLVCSSILSTEDVVRRIPFHKLKPNTIIADVLSVKQFPKKLLLDVVPTGFGILCTHPMFGKYSGKDSWEGLRFVYEKVRISKNNSQEKTCEQFLSIFKDEKCRMIEMSCEEHDEYAAGSQFVTHTVARILSNMDLESTPLDTKGFETLLELTRNTVSHGSDLYDGLFLHNVNAVKQIEKIEKSFETVKRNLFAKLRDQMTSKMDETVSTEKSMAPKQTAQLLPANEKVLKDLSSFSNVPEQDHRVSRVEPKNEVYQTTKYRENRISGYGNFF